jgi:hypothetical protein
MHCNYYLPVQQGWFFLHQIHTHTHRKNPHQQHTHTHTQICIETRRVTETLDRKRVMNQLDRKKPIGIQEH